MALKLGQAGEPTELVDGFITTGISTVVEKSREGEVYTKILNGLQSKSFNIEDISNIKRYMLLFEAMNLFSFRYSERSVAEIERAIVDFEIENLLKEKHNE